MAPRVDIQYVQFYTQGSAARQVAPAVSPNTGSLPKMKRRKLQKVCIDPVAILGMAVAACMLIMMLVGVVRLNAEQKRTARMEQRVELLQMENDRLQAQFDAECDLEEIEKTALALGMVPAEQVPQSTITVAPPETSEPEPVSLWQRIGTFLSGLFS